MEQKYPSKMEKLNLPRQKQKESIPNIPIRHEILKGSLQSEVKDN
jgi:hypothetical protein